MSAVFSRPPAPKTRGPRMRLPWWALALPVLSFVVLLVLVASPSEAGAASPPRSPAPLLEFLAGIIRAGT